MSYIEHIKRSQNKFSEKFEKYKLIHKIGFKIRNVTFEEYKNLSNEDRKQLHIWAFEENKEWIKKRIIENKAAWLIVIDGKVISFSNNLDEYPSEKQIMDICQKTKKFPFIFVNDDMLAIEEKGFGWNETKYERDVYPTLGLKLYDLDKMNSKPIIADFDTGALGVFIDIDLLSSVGIIEETLFDIPRISSHLNNQYEYLFKSVILQIEDLLNHTSNEVKKTISCVKNWNSSPFVHINPNRAGLVGRSIPNELQILIILDFKDKRTTVKSSDASTNYS